MVERHPLREQEVIDYLRGQIPDESVTRIECVHTEGVNRKQYEVWDVQTDSERYWVVAPLTNFYLQDEFPSMHAVLSLHLGLMQRMAARQRSAASDTERDRLLVADRLLELAGRTLDEATDAADFQAVALKCRETLLAIVHAIASESLVPAGLPTPKRDDFTGWIEHLANGLAPGRSDKRLRALMKDSATATWNYVGVVVHDKSASRFDGDMVMGATGHVFAMYALATVRAEEGDPYVCPECGSYEMRDYYQHDFPEDEKFVWACSKCHWQKPSPVPMGHRPSPSPQQAKNVIPQGGRTTHASGRPILCTNGPEMRERGCGHPLPWIWARAPRDWTAHNARPYRRVGCV